MFTLSPFRRALVLVIVLALLAGTLLALAGASGSAAAAPRAGRALHGPATAVYAGDPVTLTGRTPRKRATVVLQRRDGTRWVRAARTTSNRKGRFTFRVAAPAATTSYRAKAGTWTSRVAVVQVVARPGGGQQPPRPTAVKLSAPAATRTDTVLPVTASVRPGSSGHAVTLQRQTGAGWTPVATAVTDAAGQARFTVTVTDTVVHRAEVRPLDGSAALLSPAHTITVLTDDTTPWVTGYYAGWFWDQEYAPHEVDMDAVTHLVLGRVTPGGGRVFRGNPGDVVPAAGTFHSEGMPGYPESVEQYLVDRAREAGTEVLLMLGGDGEAGAGFVASTATDEVRGRFVENIVDYLVAHDYDGVDLDWENCFGGTAAECGVGITEAEATRRLKALILDIRAEMATRARYAEDPGIIAFPHYALNLNIAPHRVKDWQVEVAAMVDQFNLMSYGVGTTWYEGGWKSWFSGALDGEDPDGYPVSIDHSIDAYEAAGVERSRIGVGIGFYGIYYGPSVDGPRQSLEGNSIYEVQDATLSYANLVRQGYLSHGAREFDEDASSTYRVYDGDGFVPDEDPQRNPAGFLSYEDEESIAAKAAYVHAGNAGGAMIWTLNYDAMPDGSNPLLAVVKRDFLGR